jgi:hypothetical protein
MLHARPTLLAVLVLLLVIGFQSTARSPLAAVESYAEETFDSSQMPLPDYKPRKENGPRARIGGQSRGMEGDVPLLVALVPDHVAYTIKNDPSLCWYLSRQTSNQLTVTLVDSRGIRPILEESLPSPLGAGIHCIQLGQYGVTLREQEQYRWFVTLVLDPERPSRDVVAGGTIERIPFSEACALDMPCTWTSCDREAINRYSESGLWYDAIACLLDLIEHDGNNASLKAILQHLLNQSGVYWPG